MRLEYTDENLNQRIILFLNIFLELALMSAFPVRVVFTFAIDAVLNE